MLKESAVFHFFCHRLFLVALCLVFPFTSSPNVFAETDSLLEGAAPSVEVEKVSPPKVETPAPEVSKSELPPNEKSKSEIYLLGGPAFNSYRLSGSGLTSSIPTTLGSVMGLGYSITRASGRGAFFRLNRSINQHENFTTVSPSVVTIRHTRVEGGFRVPVADSWGAVFGYGYMRREGTQTTPTSVVGQYKAHGPIVGMEHCYDFEPKRWRLLSHFLTRLPLYFYEDGSATGSHVGSTELEIGTGLLYRVSRQLEFALNVQARGSFHFYRGSGTRGVAEGRERDFLVLSPFELRWTF